MTTAERLLGCNVHEALRMVSCRCSTNISSSCIVISQLRRLRHRGERSGPWSLGEPVASGSYQKCHLCILRLPPQPIILPPVQCLPPVTETTTKHWSRSQGRGAFVTVSGACVSHVASYHLCQQPVIYHLPSPAPFSQWKLRIGELKEPAWGARSW